VFSFTGAILEKNNFLFRDKMSKENLKTIFSIKIKDFRQVTNTGTGLHPCWAAQNTDKQAAFPPIR
jgi:hypothetical protein